MKKLIVILIIVCTFCFVGALYGRKVQSDKRETVKVEQTHMNQYPDPMPKFVMDPMTGFPLY